MQEVITGENSIAQLSDLLRERGFRSVFIITGSHFPFNDHSLHFTGLTFQHYIKKGECVTEQDIASAWSVFSSTVYDCIVAIGGGSVLDTAKALLNECLQHRASLPFFIAIPTTAGSGSEATHFAVIYHGKKKVSLANPALLPAVVILDPVLTHSLSAYQTAVSGIDVLAQAIESWWNKNATAESRADAAASINLWRSSYQTAIATGDTIARQHMQQAAYRAGKAINITRTTGPHALSYYLTAWYGIPHGQAVAIFLPLFFIYNNIYNELNELLGQDTPAASMEYIQSEMRNAGLVTTLAELQIDKSSVMDALLDEVNEERFANNPVSFDRNRLRQLIEKYC